MVVAGIRTRAPVQTTSVGERPRIDQSGADAQERADTSSAYESTPEEVVPEVGLIWTESDHIDHSSNLPPAPTATA